MSKQSEQLAQQKVHDLMAINPSLRIGSWLIILLLSCFISWSFIAHIDEVVIAAGVVAPQEQIKVIQHLEGGILEDIMVKEGHLVKKGQVLLKLSLGIGKINREEKQAELDSLLLTRARLQAHINQLKPVFSDIINTQRPALVAAEQLSFESEQRELKNSLTIAQTQIDQQRLEISELKAQLSTLIKERAIQQEQFNISDNLLAKELTSKLEHLEITSRLEQLNGQIRIIRQSIPKAESNYAEVLAQREQISEQFQHKMTNQLNKTEQFIARITELLSQANDQNLRTEIKSPINGIVKKMRYNTLHGVVKPGEAIMEIVPHGDNLIIEAKLNPADRGYIRTGQKATVKLTTYDYSRYGGLEGQVVQIGADTLTEQSTGQTYYEVDVKTDKNHLGQDKSDLPITPGMETSIEIHTGTRTVFEYLLKPLLRIKNEAFRER